ncbi:Rieske (2Fe-2S) protein [Sediminibacterium ginsengisoli]|uniref:Rieske Fe-S protein n=1 Tax=Sediminibacterium ginsengisoli TaxID=413434 RepID=A0A1T4NWL5_9BACT|nr:Rieske 2Fe-2S domain-containing protein [Sediminibacterium ginsengisoli]SJZ83595.1 Rieske Fe-S protein [Sediminibacterium ginsengisoli]
MTRKDFLKNACNACLSVTLTGTLISSCTPTQYISGKIQKDGITILKTDFVIHKGKNQGYNSFIIVRNETLLYPICVHRISDADYAAVWMRCTHQGTELQVSGDMLQCAAHGSEFNKRGIVTNGPAGSNLRSFPVKVNGNEIFIDLRKLS